MPRERPIKTFKELEAACLEKGLLTRERKPIWGLKWLVKEKTIPKEHLRHFSLDLLKSTVTAELGKMISLDEEVFRKVLQPRSRVILRPRESS